MPALCSVIDGPRREPRSPDDVRRAVSRQMDVRGKRGEGAILEVSSEVCKSKGDANLDPAVGIVDHAVMCALRTYPRGHRQ